MTSKCSVLNLRVDVGIVEIPMSTQNAVSTTVIVERPTSSRNREARIWLDLVLLLVQRDLRVRYRGSFLGYIWSMMNPLLYMVILTFVFRHLMRFEVKNLALFILSGILGWNLFQQSLVIGVNSIVANGALLRKVKVPSTLFPAASVCSVLVNFLLALAPYLIIAIATGGPLTAWVLALPIVLIPYLAFIFGLVLLVASLNVTYRDVGHVLEPLLTMAFYATPIVYPADRLPGVYRRILDFNPLTHFLALIRNCLYDGQPPSLITLGIVCLLALVSLGIGAVVYRKNRGQFIYNL